MADLVTNHRIRRVLGMLESVRDALTEPLATEHCPTCGPVVASPGARYCGACGSRLQDDPAPPRDPQRELQASVDMAVRAHRNAIASKLEELTARTGMYHTRYDQTPGSSCMSNVGEILDRWAAEIRSGTFGVPSNRGG